MIGPHPRLPGHVGVVARPRARAGAAAALLALLIVAGPAPAAAQELPTLLAAGRAHGRELATAAALADQADAAAALTRAPLWPTLTVGAGYTRNQHASEVPLGDAPLTIVPLDQLDATASLTVPLLDLAARRRATAATADRAAAEAAVDVAARDGDRAIVRSYYAWIGGAASLSAATSARAAAVDNLALVERRAAAQLASPLDVARARAAIADADATIAAAELVVATARRQLATATGLALADAAPALPTDTAAEPPLATWLADAGAQPEVAAAAARVRAAGARLAASQAGYLPTVAATASERWTNAPGFGEALSGSLAIVATWRFGLATPRQVAVDRATARVEATRLATARQAAADRVTDAWHQVAARRAAVAAAEARVEAARLGAATARERFAAGTATQLDVTLAQRDALAAELTRVSTRAELAADRALLRLAAGREVAP
ncbi:MAG: TolC family protein [Myxococcales bacterium]|nr:TolC family protein [Myxococcales bacterium]MBK7194142.1 TolC family protein [Myxococcales bacterium]MBP6849381.1 TolC family protein [Kofleriaceae bacterium]